MSEARKSIFISYAHEDANAARRIAEALRGFGVEVFFDENELRGGDAWDAKLRQRIRECSLFMPIISAQTQNRVEGYFRREWKLATNRMDDLAAGVAFLLPVVIDDTSEYGAAVPESFTEVQWIRLGNGEPTPDFVTQVKRLLDAPRRAAPAGSGHMVGQTREGKPPPIRRPRLPGWVWVVAVVVVIGIRVAYWLNHERSAPEPGQDATSPPVQEASPSDEPPVASAGQTIAVMPLLNKSSDPENEYFASSVHDDVLTNLTRIEDLQVVSRTTMLRYGAMEMTLPEVGEALNADYIVDGSVHRIGKRVRVTVYLTDAKTDKQLWASSYERELIDDFATISELGREIANSLHLEIQPETVGTLSDMPTRSVRAYDLYLRSISLEKTEGETEEAVRQQRKMLEQAVEEDPNFVEAWALLRRIYSLMREGVELRGWYLAEGADPEKLMRELDERSERALAKAVALDPENVETLLSLAVDHTRRRPSAEVRQERKKILERVTREHPDNAMAWYHLGWWYQQLSPRDMASAFASFEEALKRDPFNARIVTTALNAYRNHGDEENASRLLDRLAQIKPETSEDRHLSRVSTYGKLRHLEAAFVESADEDLVEKYARVWAGWTTDEGEFFRRQGMKELMEYPLRVFANEQDRLVEMADDFVVPGRSGVTGISLPQARRFFELSEAALAVQWLQRKSNESEAIAQRIIEFAKLPVASEDSALTPQILASLASAHAVLGEIEKAREYGEALVKRRSEAFDPAGNFAIAAMSWIDTDRAADMALTEKKKNPDWRGLDWMAAFHLRAPQLLVHPKIQAYHVKEGKWLKYLAGRVRAYAKYKDGTLE